MLVFFPSMMCFMFSWKVLETKDSVSFTCISEPRLIKFYLKSFQVRLFKRVKSLAYHSILSNTFFPRLDGIFLRQELSLDFLLILKP